MLDSIESGVQTSHCLTGEEVMQCYKDLEEQKAIAEKNKQLRLEARRQKIQMRIENRQQREKDKLEAAKIKASLAARTKEFEEACSSTEVCGECGKRVKSKAGLKRHISSMHGKK